MKITFRKIIISAGSIIIAIVIGSLILAKISIKKTKEITTLQQQAQIVLVTPVVSQYLHREIILPGELRAYQDVAIYPKVLGFVDWIEIDRGSIVKQGQLLIRMNAPEIESKYQEAVAKTRSARAQLLEAKAKFAADEATYKRLKAASEIPGIVAGNDIEIAQKTMEADKARVRGLQENEKAAQDDAHSARSIQSYLRITAPFDGIITERNVHMGSLVGPSISSVSQPMVRIQEVYLLRLVVPVPERAVDGISPGTEVKFSVPAFPGKTFSGIVRRIAHSLDMKTRTMPVELDVNNRSLQLLPGMFPSVIWPMTRSQPSLFVPSSAVAVTTERMFVIRVRDNITEWVDVGRGTTMGSLVEVFGNLEPNDQIAALGTDQLRAGTYVTAKSAGSP